MVELGQRASDAAVDGSGPSRGGAATAATAVMPLQPAEALERPERAPPAGRARPDRRRSRAGPSPRGRRWRSGGTALPWKRFQVRTRSGTGVAYGADARRPRRSARLHAARTTTSSRRRSPARARTSSSSRRASASATRRAPDGYRRGELFYPLSSRLFRRSRLRLPVKAAEHPLGLAALPPAPAGRRCTSSGSPRPSSTLRLLRPRVPSRVHRARPPAAADAAKRDLWRRLLARFDRVVVHSEHGRTTLAGLGVDPATAARHPASGLPERPGAARRRADGALLRRDPPVQGARRRDRGGRGRSTARGCSSRATRSSRSTATAPPRRDRASGGSATCREAEVDRALGEATVARLPVPAELDQSGALLRALGAGVPAVAYDVGGIAEPVRRFGAGRVVPAGDVEALAAAVRELLGDPDALERGPRRRAARARGADVGRRGAPRTSRSTGSSRDLPPPLRRRDRPPARPLRARTTPA